MKLDAFKSMITSQAARQLFMAKKHSPKMLFVGGVVGVVGATVLACRATLKLDDIMVVAENLKIDNDNELRNEKISKEAHQKRETSIKISTGLIIAKTYAPAVGVGLVSIAALTGSHVILDKRNGALLTAYTTLDQAYKQYRKRVKDEYGVDVDRKFSLGGEDYNVEEKLADGNTTVEGKTKFADRPFGRSPYAAIFDERSKHFTREPGMNSIFLGVQQTYANDKLRGRGHLFLNEVYDMLDMPRTKQGAVVGWVWRRDNEEKTGDNYVSFGIFENEPDQAAAFLDGVENCVWLDFNVDGAILDLI